MATVAQYLDVAELRGENIPVVGGDPRHGLIIANLLGLVRPEARGKGSVPYTGARVQVSASGYHLTPDVAVAGSPAQYPDDRKAALTNPRLIIEVLSDSTEDSDRSSKFQRYRTMSSLAEYVVVDQRTPHIEHYLRQSERRWLLADLDGLKQTIHIETLDCELPFSAIYEDVEFD